MKIVFMGTPEFAVPGLQALINSEHEIKAVFCQPDRPKGRSNKPQPCPVKLCAQRADIPIYQPQRIRKRKWRCLLESFEADVFVVAAYGQILSQKILDAPKIDCINLHASLLPRWRGASPIHRALLAGDSETGVSIMRLVLELDAGPVYKMGRIPIEPQENRMSLEQRLAKLGADLLLEQLPLLEQTNPTPQSEENITYAALIKKEDGKISFSYTAKKVIRMIQAFGDWPGVFCSFRGKPLKIISAEVMSSSEIENWMTQIDADFSQPGELIRNGKKEISVTMGERTALKLLQLQPTGKKIQDIGAFLNGYQPVQGECFTEMN